MGSNSFGECGVGHTDINVWEFQRVLGLEDANIVDVDIGFSHSMGLSGTSVALPGCSLDARHLTCLICDMQMMGGFLHGERASGDRLDWAITTGTRKLFPWLVATKSCGTNDALPSQLDSIMDRWLQVRRVASLLNQNLQHTLADLLCPPSSLQRTGARSCGEKCKDAR